MQRDTESELALMDHTHACCARLLNAQTFGQGRLRVMTYAFGLYVCV